MSDNWDTGWRRASWLVVCAVVLVGISQSHGADIVPPAAQRFAPTAEVPSFQRHVVPLLGRLGCNGRACHGSFQGQAGFRLSMFGFDFASDHEALAGGDAPRVDVKNPSASLILNKPTKKDDHGGGKRYEVGGWEYVLLRRWIEAGAHDDSLKAGRLVTLEVSPPELHFKGVGQKVSLRVVAHWSDGAREDVTCLTRFSSNDESIAEVSSDGIARAIARGTAHIIASYDGEVTASPVFLPLSELVGPEYPRVPTPTRIDELVVAQLAKLGIVPSDVCTDAEFLRRVSLDITGTLPTADEAMAFLSDASPAKRSNKIDELLVRPSYTAWWTMKLCDLTGQKGNGQLGGTEMADLAGRHWHRWIEHRVATNVGYDQIARDILLATSRQTGESYLDFVKRQTSYCLAKDPVDYAESSKMPYYWFRNNLSTADDRALAVSYAFLGVRLDCAQCHKHPFDRWSQQDFKQFAALFDRVDVGYAADAQDDRKRLEELVGLKNFKNAGDRRGTYRKLSAQGEAIVPWNEVYVAPPKKDGVAPKILGGEQMAVDADRDPREALVAWLLAKDNPYFARAFVNRVWAHYFGVGIVDPPDDFNLANPPSNKALLENLAQGFVEQGYDMKWLHRQIANSRTYQLSRQTNETNRLDTRLFSHSLVRRLPAEVVVDAIALATTRQDRLDDFMTQVADRKINEQPPAKLRGLDYGLAIFGKPIRDVNCDCERQSDPSLQQAIYMLNDRDLWARVDADNGWLAEVDELADGEALVRQAYLRALSRLPTAAEMARCREHFAKGGVKKSLRDVLWALLNTQEFVTNH